MRKMENCCPWGRGQYTFLSGASDKVNRSVLLERTDHRGIALLRHPGPGSFRDRRAGCAAAPPRACWAWPVSRLKPDCWPIPPCSVLNPPRNRLPRPWPTMVFSRARADRPRPPEPRHRAPHARRAGAFRRASGRRLPRLAALAASHPTADALMAAARRAGLQDLASDIVAAWYTGTVGRGRPPSSSPEEALMYQPVRRAHRAHLLQLWPALVDGGAAGSGGHAAGASPDRFTWRNPMRQAEFSADGGTRGHRRRRLGRRGRDDRGPAERPRLRADPGGRPAHRARPGRGKLAQHALRQSPGIRFPGPVSTVSAGAGAARKQLRSPDRSQRQRRRAICAPWAAPPGGGVLLAPPAGGPAHAIGLRRGPRLADLIRGAGALPQAENEMGVAGPNDPAQSSAAVPIRWTWCRGPMATSVSPTW